DVDRDAASGAAVDAAEFHTNATARRRAIGREPVVALDKDGLLQRGYLPAKTVHRGPRSRPHTDDPDDRDVVDVIDGWLRRRRGDEIERSPRVQGQYAVGHDRAGASRRP